jgi:hypothetical protein
MRFLLALVSIRFDSKVVHLRERDADMANRANVPSLSLRLFENYPPTTSAPRRLFKVIVSVSFGCNSLIALHLDSCEM